MSKEYRTRPLTSAKSKKISRPRVTRDPVRLRYPRKEVMEKLGISMSTIIRREQAGKLKPIRDVPGGGVYYSHADLMKLAKG